jgi:serine/threonine-protein kinase
MTTDLGQPGQIIDGKYRIVRLLGTGGMGAVYEGENVRIRRKVAIKMLHASVSDQKEAVDRFEREAKAAGMVGSEHICEVLDMGELPDHSLFMVMEYLDGETLSGLIKRSGRLTPQQSIPLLLQVLEGLGAAHAAGIIHRDLKPDNIFILPHRGGIQNFVKILDFGVSKFSQASGESMNVTRAGAVVGTPYYMSPEQARGGVVDQRTDIYSIGVLLYQATTGQVPYNAETFNELLFKIVLEAAPPLQTYVPDIDPEFAAIVQRAMAREPDKRFPTCAQFRDALLQYQATRLAAPAPRAPAQHDPFVARTEVIDLSALPGGRSSASWPGAPPAPPHAGLPVPTDGTLPMQPGLQVAGAPGMIPGAGQSGASWPGAPVPGAAPPVAGAPQGMPAPMATSNSWGNQSSPSNPQAKPKSKAGLVIGVVGGAMVLGVGVAVAAFFMLGKGPRGVASASTAKPTATVVATDTPTAAPAASSTAAPSASAAPADTAEPADSASPTAAASAAQKPGLPGKASPGGASTGKPGSTKPGTQPTGKPPGGKKPPGSDLGY